MENFTAKLQFFMCGMTHTVIHKKGAQCPLPVFENDPSVLLDVHPDHLHYATHPPLLLGTDQLQHATHPPLLHGTDLLQHATHLPLLHVTDQLHHVSYPHLLHGTDLLNHVSYPPLLPGTDQLHHFSYPHLLLCFSSKHYNCQLMSLNRQIITQ